MILRIILSKIINYDGPLDRRRYTLQFKAQFVGHGLLLVWRLRPAVAANEVLHTAIRQLFYALLPLLHALQALLL